MRQQMTWRVRVKRAVEEWIDVQADTAAEAERLALHIPFVISVFGQSAMKGNKPVDRIPAMGVVEDENE